MSGPVDTPVLPSSRDFSVFSQKLELDLDFPTKSLIGKTELVILPLSKELRTIRLNCRQCTITRLTVEGKPATWKYQDPYQRLRAHSSFGVHQHHLFRVKIESQLNDPPEEELVFNLPRGIRVQEISPFSAAVKDTHSTNSIQGVGDTSASLVTPGASTAVEPSAAFASLKIRIEFENHNVRDGLHFVGLDGGDRRYPHVYTRNSPYPGTASCLFPCVDDPRSRCSWEVSIRCPRTLGDVFERRSSPASNAQDSGEPGYDKPKASLRNGNVIAVSPDNVELQDSTGLDDEEKLLEMSVVCSGEMTDEVGSSLVVTEWNSDDHRSLTLKTLRARLFRFHAPRGCHPIKLDLQSDLLRTLTCPAFEKSMMTKSWAPIPLESTAFVCLEGPMRFGTPACR